MSKWDETFKNYKTTTFEQIKEYVLTEKPEYEEVLRSNIMNGMSYLSVKRSFYQKYFKKYIPVAKPKKPSMKDWAQML